MERLEVWAKTCPKVSLTTLYNLVTLLYSGKLLSWDGYRRTVFAQCEYFEEFFL